MKIKSLRDRLALLFSQGISPKQYYEILQYDLDAQSSKLRWDIADQSIAWQSEADNRYIIAHDDDLYPPLLRETAACPPVIFVEGQVDLLSKPQVAVVGSRKATPNGLESAYELAFELAHHDIVVTSGMARGIDTSAHVGALEQGETIAVLGTGIDVVYPKSNMELKDKIVENGAIVSEFSLKTQPNATNFPRRNRIISGLSLGVIVIEAQAKSGSLITARCALEQNREVMALPGLAGDPSHCGCHKLIKQGAFLVETVQDVFAALGIEVAEVAKGSMVKPKEEAIDIDGLTTEQKQVLSAVDFKLTSIDMVQKRSNIDIKYCLTALSELAWLQLVEQVDGGFIRKRDF